MREDYLSGDAHNLSPADKEMEMTLRPLNFDDFTGQFKVVDNIKIFVQAAKKRGEALDHVLLHGPPGLGKTTLSHIIANELNTNIKVSSGPILDKPGDLAGLLTNLEDYDVLFIDEIHRLNPPSVSVVASPIAKGTLRTRARVRAKSVLPEPVGPTSRILDFSISISDPSQSSESRL